MAFCYGFFGTNERQLFVGEVRTMPQAKAEHVAWIWAGMLVEGRGPRRGGLVRVNLVGLYRVSVEEDG